MQLVVRLWIGFHALLAAAPFVAMLWIAVAQAQQGGPPNSIGGIVLGGNTSLTVATTTSNIALPSSTTPYPFVTLINDGSNELFFAYGGSAVTATTSSYPLPVGECVSFWANGATKVAAIGSGGATTLRIIQTSGPGC